MSEYVDSDAANLLLESIAIRRSINEEGTEIVVLEAKDALGEPLGIVEALNLLNYSRLQLEAELMRAFVFEEDGDDE